MGKFIRNNVHIIAFVLFLLLFLVAYRFIPFLNSEHRTIKIDSIDDKIPLVLFFVIPYLLFIPFMLLPFIMSRKDKKMFKVLAFTFLATVVSMNLFYMAFPAEIIRPEITGTDIFSKLTIFVYTVDKPLNLFPSGHVVFILLSNLCMLHINKKASFFMIPFTFLIGISTVFIKQHYVPDILGGIILSLIMYWFVFLKLLKRENITAKSSKLHLNL